MSGENRRWGEEGESSHVGEEDGRQSRAQREMLHLLQLPRELFPDWQPEDSYSLQTTTPLNAHPWNVFSVSYKVLMNIPDEDFFVKAPAVLAHAFLQILKNSTNPNAKGRVVLTHEAFHKGGISTKFTDVSDLSFLYLFDKLETAIESDDEITFDGLEFTFEFCYPKS